MLHGHSTLECRSVGHSDTPTRRPIRQNMCSTRHVACPKKLTFLTRLGHIARPRQGLVIHHVRAHPTTASPPLPPPNTAATHTAQNPKFLKTPPTTNSSLYNLSNQFNILIKPETDQNTSTTTGKFRNFSSSILPHLNLSRQAEVIGMSRMRRRSYPHR
ncbi:hypothetical protein ACLB2K_035563 [Fragaria x ananassa]